MGGRKVIARVKAQVAFQQRSDYEDFIEVTGDMPNFNVVQELNQRCLEAEQEYRSAYHECSCKPNSALACLACLEWSRQHYGDSIPFGEQP
jgi:hypothetical protein